MNQKRRNEIAEMIEKQHTVTNHELIEKFGISIETVRRDLAYLEKHGVLKRVYGGAVKNEIAKNEPLYISREQINSDEKERIAEATEKLINSDDIVFFDLGTTVEKVAKKLRKDKSIHAFTNAVRTAIVLSEKSDEVILTGGKIRAGEYALSGGIAEENLSKFNIDKAIIGAAGITDTGVSDFITDEALFRKKVIENAKEVILISDYTKFGVKAMCNVCDISCINVLVTDEKAPKEVLKSIEKKGIKVIVAKGNVIKRR